MTRHTRQGRAANRINIPPDRRDSFVGFRLVLHCE